MDLKGREFGMLVCHDNNIVRYEQIQEFDSLNADNKKKKNKKFPVTMMVYDNVMSLS